MRDDHAQAHNLFSRLISYSPRIGEGSRTRTALEDYYTEALAWCLRSPDFRKIFFDLIREPARNSGRGLPQGNEVDLEIHTQLSFAQNEDEEPEEAKAAPIKRRRFDLVIQSSADRSLVIVVENKVSWRFTENQLPAYRNELNRGQRFKDFKTKLLIVLSPSGENPGPGGTVPAITLRWSEVQQKLTEFSGVAHGRSQEQMNVPVIRFVCAQFADFLKEKGLAPMKIAPTDHVQLNGWIAGFEAQENMTRILAAIREGRKTLKKAPVFDAGSDGQDDGSRWFGLYGKGAEYFYLGFRLRDRQSRAELHLWIQMNSPKQNRLTTKLIGELKADGATVSTEDGGRVLNFSLKVTGTQLDGNADRMREWFENTLTTIDRILPPPA